jgi:3-oxoadipate enol-lactonase
MEPSSCQKVEVEPEVRLEVDAGAPSTLPAVIFSNSIGSDYGMWDEVVARMKGRVRLVRYNTRGHGGSALGDQPLTIVRLGLDVIAIMDALEIRRAVFCGLSLGGLTGQWLGSAFPERFDGLILANTAPNFPPPDLWMQRARAVRERGMRELVGPTLERWLTKEFRDRRPDRTAEVAKMVEATSAEGYARCCELLATSDLAEALPKISAPVRVICGQYDPSTPPTRGAEIVAAARDADLLTLNAAHISAIEAADAFAAAGLEFVERVTSAEQGERSNAHRKNVL